VAEVIPKVSKAKPVPSVSADEKRWRAESDARTIAEAKVIMGDPGRMKAAATAAKKMVEDKKAELAGLKQVARKGK
jgi:hypothetical protein